MKMKKFLEQDSTGIILAFNLGTAALTDAMRKIEPALHMLLLLGQIVVTAATVYYFWRKARAVRLPGEKKPTKRKTSR